MNASEIKMAMANICTDKVDYSGREPKVQDSIIMDVIMKLYFETDWMDWEECLFLFVTYLEKGRLDFSEAKKRAMWRIKCEKENDIQ